jgi:hypothetical protein
LETAAKLLKLRERVLPAFSKCALKLLDNQADFDSAIPRFESWRRSQVKALKTRNYLAALLGPLSSFRNSVPCAFGVPEIRCACRFRVAAIELGRLGPPVFRLVARLVQDHRNAATRNFSKHSLGITVK